MNIGIYGGTFNPIHRGHTSLASSLVEQGLLDEVWLMVSPQNPLKGNDAAPYEDRFRMAQIAVKNVRGVVPSDFEHHLPIPSYTITTLTELSQTYPQHRFHLIIGADNWQNFNRWYRSEDILKTYPIVVYRRPGYEFDDEKLKEYPNVIVAETPLFDVSSTEIRAHKKLRMVHPLVLRYIKENHLYGYL